MRKIRETLGLKIEEEGLKSNMEEVKVVTYEDALNIALKALEKFY